MKIVKLGNVPKSWMDLANQNGGLVLGTGDLSELALGWATYNGDHMSMYGVNASVPKTLIRHIVAYEAAACGDPALQRTLEDILATPVSPELLPADNGEISQKTEDLVGLMPCTISFCITLYAGRLRLPKSIDWLVMRLATPMIPTRSKNGWSAFTGVFSPSSLNALACRTDS